MSFLTLGIFWVGQQSQLNHLRRSDVRLTWIHLPFLFAVTLMPFSTKLLGAHHAYRTALLEYWGNILIFGATLYASWGYATRAGLVKNDISPEVPAAVCRRIIIGQFWYALRAALLFQHLPQHARNHLRPTVLHPLPVAPPSFHLRRPHSSRHSMARLRM
jgi:uncharacterized membrane protein